MRSAFFLWISFYLVAGDLALYSQEYPKSAIAFFYAVKRDDLHEASREVKQLAEASADILKRQLDTEAKAKSFWLNIYNTFVQYQLKRDPDLFKDRDAFFKDPSITIAGQKLSLDDIEHGIIRRSTNKYSFGYFASLFVTDFERKFRLEEIDYRIHFALNCGATSCPPIALYEADRVEVQLENATRSYLESHAKYDQKLNRVYAPALCSWYRGDFGGESGVVAMTHKYGIVPASRDPAVEYLPYDWTLRLSHYIAL